MTEAISIETQKLKEVIKEGNDLWRADDFKGMLYHYKALRVFFEDAAPLYRRMYFCNLAIAYREAEELDLTIENYTKALGVCGDEDESDIATINANLANVLLDLKRADEALIYLAQPEDYHRRNKPSDSEEQKKWAFRLGNALETKARALSMVNERTAIKAANEAVNLLLEYCEDSKATGRAIKTLWMCWEAKG